MNNIVPSYLRGEWSHSEPPSAEANRRSRPNAQPRCNHRLLKPLRGSSKPQKVGGVTLPSSSDCRQQDPMIVCLSIELAQQHPNSGQWFPHLQNMPSMLDQNVSS